MTARLRAFLFATGVDSTTAIAGRAPVAGKDNNAPGGTRVGAGAAAAAVRTRVVASERANNAANQQQQEQKDDEPHVLAGLAVRAFTRTLRVQAKSGCDAWPLDGRAVRPIHFVGRQLPRKDRFGVGKIRDFDRLARGALPIHLAQDVVDGRDVAVALLIGLPEVLDAFWIATEIDICGTNRLGPEPARFGIIDQPSVTGCRREE